MPTSQKKLFLQAVLQHIKSLKSQIGSLKHQPLKYFKKKEMKFGEL